MSLTTDLHFAQQLKLPLLLFRLFLLYFVVQQIENNLIVPKVMGKSTGLNPLVVILAILMGARIGGIVGALLAVPVAIGVAVYLGTIMDKKSSNSLIK